MSQTGISSLDRSVNETKEWLRSLQKELNLDTEDQALDGLRATLRALRDRLTPEESTGLAAQLPVVLRGFYYEGWRPVNTPRKIRDEDEFLGLITKNMGRPNDPKLSDARRIARGVFKVLSHHVSPGEVRHVRSSFPEGLQRLWEQDEPKDVA